MHERPSILTHLPILHRQEMMLPSMKDPVPTVVPSIIVQFLSLQPLLIVQFAPITTFGPILQPYSTLAV